MRDTERVVRGVEKRIGHVFSQAEGSQLNSDASGDSN